MNVEDFLSTVGLSVNGWLYAEGAEAGAALSAHNALLALVRDERFQSVSNVRSGARFKKYLLKRVNELSVRAINEASCALQELTSTHCQLVLSEREEDGVLVPEPIDLQGVPALEVMPEVLSLSSSLRLLSPRSQLGVVRAQSVIAEIEYQRMAIHWAKEEGDVISLQTHSTELAKAEARLSRIQEQLGTAGHAWLLGNPRSEPVSWWSIWPLVPGVDHSLSAEDLEAVGSAYAEIGFWLTKPLPIAAVNDLQLARQWESLWKIYDQSGNTLVLLSSWLKALSVTQTANRCLICFRHVGPGLKRFCTSHKRTAEVRIPAHELRVSTIYKSLLKNKTTPAEKSFLSSPKRLPSAAAAASFKSAAVAFGVPHRLLNQVTYLAACLMGFRPVIGAQLEWKVEHHFARFVRDISKPYLVSHADLQVNPTELAYYRNVCAKSCNLLEYLRSWYGTTLGNSVLQKLLSCSANDPDNPLITSGAVQMEKLAVDWVHHSKWTQADGLVSELAYVSLATLGRTASGKEGPSPSLRSIAARLRVSQQTVLQSMRYMSGDSSSNSKPRRERATPQGVATLRRLTS